MVWRRLHLSEVRPTFVTNQTLIQVKCLICLNKKCTNLVSFFALQTIVLRFDASVGLEWVLPQQVDMACSIG